MLASVERNRRFLGDLFAGPFRGHAVIVNAIEPGSSELGDWAISAEPIARWRDWAVKCYEAQLESHEKLDDDSVPYVSANTNTGIFAGAFGCPIHVYEEETNAAAEPIVRTAEEADALDEPGLEAPTLRRVFEFARMAGEALGPEAPVSVPDIQSPFDIAALVWRKEDFFVALHTDPDAVKRLVDKAERLLTGFLDRYLEEFPNVNLCHCPRAWAPRELGVWLSEDEAGSISPAMFEEFCLPSLKRLSDRYGGIFIHCCADAGHQYPSFAKVPNLRAWNRVFTDKGGPGVALEAFPETPFIVAWTEEEDVYKLLDVAPPTMRFLVNMDAQESLDQA